MMRFIFTTILSLVFAINLKAQQLSEESLKPMAKQHTLELNLSPGNQIPLSISQFRYRYFIEEDLAFRMGVFTNYKNQRLEQNGINQRLDLQLRPGFEKHFKGSERLSPFWGAELLLASSASSSERQPGFGFPNRIEGAWDMNGLNRASSQLGLNALIGMDFYIHDKVFFGTEMAYGFVYTHYHKIYRYVSYNFIESIENSSAWLMAPSFRAAIRIGYVF